MAYQPHADAKWLQSCAWFLTKPFVDAGHLPLDARGWKGLDEAQSYAGLVTSQFDEWDEAWELEGEWPEGLGGTFTRMGPLGFDSRSGQRKRSVIDSAGGLIREFQLNPWQPRFRARHVKTSNYMAELESGRFERPSITTLAPGRFNSALRAANQASVAAYRRGSKYWVTDEMRRPIALNRGNLSTTGEFNLDPLNPKAIYLAHGKRDPLTGNLCFLSLKPGRFTVARLICLNEDDSVASRSAPVRLPVFNGKGAPYFHDWALTGDHLVFFLHPVFYSKAGILKSLAGLAPMMVGLKPDGSVNAQIMLVPRSGAGAPRLFDAGLAAQAWHFVNAFEEHGKLHMDLAATEIIAGVDAPPALEAAMMGQEIKPSAPTSFFRRFSVDLAAGSVARADLLTDANYEFPTIPESKQGRPYRFAYIGRSFKDSPWQSGFVKWDHEAGSAVAYEFPDHQFAGEPVFAARSGGAEEDDGFVLVDVYDSQAKRNHLAVFNARDIGAGPVARLWLSRHLPLGFHGGWSP